ncbi:MAG: hypothetical protein PVI21_05325 [Candidatus Woesebacteria bacterium]|jgi:hypothetical protein
MRISCTAFARVVNQDCYALLRNSSMLRKEGKLRLGPVGGALHCNSDRRQKLIDQFSAHSFEGERDLRFQIPDNYAPHVVEWFASRADREMSVLREFYEELVEEEHILSDEQVSSANETFLGFASMRGAPKPRYGMVATLRLFEVYDVTISADAMQKLLCHARHKDRVYFATQAEIRNQQDLGGGYSVAEIAPALVDFSNKLVIPNI